MGQITMESHTTWAIAVVALPVLIATAAVGHRIAAKKVAAVEAKAAVAPTIRTFDWIVPAGLPAAGTVRKAFIVIPNRPRPRDDAATVLYSYCSLSNNPNNPGAWATPEIGRQATPPDGKLVSPHVYEEKEAPIADPNTAAFASAGLYVIGLDQGNDYGAHRAELPEFVRWMSERYHTAPVVEGWVRSRGGLYLLNLLAEVPTLFDRVGGISPISDGRAYDRYGIAISYTGIQSPLDAFAAFSAAENGAKSIRDLNTPNLKTASMAASHIPVMLAYGTADLVVLPDDNAKQLYSRYVENGGTRMTIIPVPGADYGLTRRIVPALRDFMLADRGETSLAENKRPTAPLTVPAPMN